jgi:exonuclease III
MDPTPQLLNMTSNKSKNLLLNIASLNCNSIVKANNPKKRSKFIRYLRSLNFDIMTLQETHVSYDNLAIINTQFQAKSSIWTRDCGIISFNPAFVLSNNLNPIEDSRIILTKVTHPHHAYAPFWVLVLYAPASSNQPRKKFFTKVLHLLQNTSLDLDLDRILILGDFNYSYLRSNLFSQTSIDWVSFLNNRFSNALSIGDLQEMPTFRRNDSIYSTIDYIFVSNVLRNHIQESDLHKLDSDWTDHSLLSTKLVMGTLPNGPGLWRANPLIVRNPQYQQYLQHQLHDILLQTPSVWTPQMKWDHIKVQVKKSYT